MQAESLMNPCDFTPSRCHIDLGALSRNFSRLGEASALMPVIKADAYGHGLLPVAHALDKAGAQRFAVGTVDEGVALREAGFSQTIVPLLGALNTKEWQMARIHRLTPPANSMDDILQAAAACQPGDTFSIAVKCDTGMNRLGFKAEDLSALVDRLRRFPQLKPDLVFSHLACADMPEEVPYTQAQMERFLSMSDFLRDAFPGMARSLGSSAASLRLPQNRYEFFRPGIALYGGNPFSGTEWSRCGTELEWVMSVGAPIIQLRKLKMGQSVSYGRIFTAPQDMNIAVVAAGYATGVARALSNHCDLLVNGRRCPQSGRICMNMLMVDVSAQPHVREGDTAWLLGGAPEPGQRAVTAQELADELGTIPYEVLCLMGSTNPRIYH